MFDMRATSKPAGWTDAATAAVLTAGWAITTASPGPHPSGRPAVLRGNRTVHSGKPGSWPGRTRRTWRQYQLQQWARPARKASPYIDGTGAVNDDTAMRTFTPKSRELTGAQPRSRSGNGPDRPP